MCRFCYLLKDTARNNQIKILQATTPKGGGKARYYGRRMRTANQSTRRGGMVAWDMAWYLRRRVGGGDGGGGERVLHTNIPPSSLLAFTWWGRRYHRHVTKTSPTFSPLFFLFLY